MAASPHCIYILLREISLHRESYTIQGITIWHQHPGSGANVVQWNTQIYWCPVTKPWRSTKNTNGERRYYVMSLNITCNNYTYDGQSCCLTLIHTPLRGLLLDQTKTYPNIKTCDQFTDMDSLWSQHVEVITSNTKRGVKFLIHFQNLNGCIAEVWE